MRCHIAMKLWTSSAVDCAYPLWQIQRMKVYTKWCEKKLSQYKWYKYRLTIKGVKEYNIVNIEDFYKKKINTPSSFSEVLDISNDKPNLRTIIIETYDWVYIVTCKNLEFAVIGYR